MAKVTTLEAAKNLLQKLVDARINRAPLPDVGGRVYPIAALPNGKLLLSDGNQRVKPIMDKLRDLKEQQAFGDSQKSPSRYLTGLTFNIAVPARQAGEGAVQRAEVFSRYLNSVLQPDLAAPAETGLPALIPEIEQQAQGFTQPVQQKLPKLAPRVESTINEGKLFNDITKGLDAFKKALKEDFERQFSVSEREVNPSVQGNIPLVRNYGQTYALPKAETAQYAQISGNPFALTNRIR